MKKRGLSLHIILRPFLFLLFCSLFPLYLSAQRTESVTGKDNVGRLIEPPEPIEHIFLNVDSSFVCTINQQYTPSTGDTLSYNITYNDLHIIKDHLDSPRKIFTNLTVRERNYYYPFGLRTDQGRAYPTFSDRYTVKVPRLTQSTGGTTTQIGYRSTAPYTLQYNGKELQLLANTSLIDYGARQYNPTLARWTAQDPLSEKYYGISPYAYCIGNPINAVDINGEDIYMLFYTLKEEMFKASAETRKREIEKMKGFNPEKDKVIMFGISDLGQIRNLVSWTVDTYSEKYGQTVEAGIWSHGGWHGPIGDVSTSGDYALPYHSQMSLDGWNNINFNWSSERANMIFYGCNTGNEIWKKSWEGAFARKISSQSSFRGVYVWGQQSASFPSFSPYRRETNIARSLGFGYGKGSTYMVGGNKNQGKDALGFTSAGFPRANLMNVYRNGRWVRSAYQNR